MRSGGKLSFRLVKILSSNGGPRARINAGRVNLSPVPWIQTIRISCLGNGDLKRWYWSWHRGLLSATLPWRRWNLWNDAWSICGIGWFFPPIGNVRFVAEGLPIAHELVNSKSILVKTVIRRSVTTIRVCRYQPGRRLTNQPHHDLCESESVTGLPFRATNSLPCDRTEKRIFRHVMSKLQPSRLVSNWVVIPLIHHHQTADVSNDPNLCRPSRQIIKL